MSAVINLKTTDEVVNLLDEILSGGEETQISFDNLHFSKELSQFVIEIDGANYNKSITGGLAKGIHEFQQQFYRAVATALYQEGSITRLTKEDLDRFNLVFKVEFGCIKLSDDWVAQLAPLRDRMIDMNDTDFTILVLALAVIFVGGFCLWKLVSKSMDNKKEITIEAERTKQMEVVRKAAQQVHYVKTFEEATTEGTKAIVKGASDASEISVGETTINKDEIRQINKKASSKRNTEKAITVDDFHIETIKISREEIGVKRFFLHKKGMELNAFIIEDDFEEDQLEALRHAAWSATSIRLEITSTMPGHKKAYISDIIIEDNEL